MDNYKVAVGIVGNTLNLLYNVPFMYQVYKNNNTKNISTCFLILRNLGSLSWIIYGILDLDLWIILSYIVTLSSSLFVSFYKIKDKINKNNDENTI
jgi:uncharacterized protein with PQ loop repeat